MARIGHLTSQIVYRKMSRVQTETLLVSFEPHFTDVLTVVKIQEQKVNGVIKYVKIEQTQFQRTSKKKSRKVIF